ncbi:hypothetical protein ACFE04_024271 [Oxalis oulophora]
MAASLLLKNLCCCISCSTSSSSSSTSPALLPPPQSSSSSSSSIGLLDSLPLDIITKILRLMGPTELTNLSKVCKMMKSIAEDNRFWIHFFNEDSDLIFFAEFTLPSIGYPNTTIQTSSMHPDEAAKLPLMRIYWQRMHVPGSIIIDGGSGYCKFGWSKHDIPSGRTPTFMEFGNIESPMYERLQHFFGTIFNRMQVKPSTQPVVVSIPLCHYDEFDSCCVLQYEFFLHLDTESAKASRRLLKQSIYTVLFDMHVPAVCAVNQATLALYAAKRTSGIVVNIGFQVTSIVPILNGKVMRKVGVEVIGIGALKLTGYLRQLMQQNNINFGSVYTVRTLKENLCYVAADYEAELSKDTQASMEIPGEGVITLSKERFQTGEILFQPRLAEVRTMALDRAVFLCIDHCRDADLTGDDTWFKTIVLTGGSACLPGLAERLEKELNTLCPSLSDGIEVIPPPFGADTACSNESQNSTSGHEITQGYSQLLMIHRALANANSGSKNFFHIEISCLFVLPGIRLCQASIIDSYIDKPSWNMIAVSASLSPH